MTSRNQTSTTLLRMMGAASVLSVVTMAGCAKITSLFRPAPVESNPVRIAQSDGDSEMDADAAVAQRPMSARPADVFANTPNRQPTDTPDVNVYGEFDGFERSNVQPASNNVGFQQQTFL